MYTDDILTAFLDGETSGDLTKEIEVVLATDSNLKLRIMALTVEKDVIASAFDPILDLAETRNLQLCLDRAHTVHTANNNSKPNALLRVASYVAVAVIGAAMSWSVFAPQDNWRVEVAHYQALYVSDTLSSITPDDARLNVEFGRASKALGMPLDPATFTGIDGLTLRRAQVLGFEGAPLVQVAFTLADGTPFAFCIMKTHGKISAIESSTMVGLASAYWSDRNYGFLAIGGDDNSLAISAAKEIAARL